MHATTALHAQLAQRLFGFHETAGVHGFTLWKDAAGTVHHAIPHYTTNPAATALVWQWLETVGQMQDLSFHYDHPPGVACQVSYLRPGDEGYHFVFTAGATWPAALCRAALALAAAREREEKR